MCLEVTELGSSRNGSDQSPSWSQFNIQLKFALNLASLNFRINHNYNVLLSFCLFLVLGMNLRDLYQKSNHLLVISIRPSEFF